MMLPRSKTQARPPVKPDKRLSKVSSDGILKCYMRANQRPRNHLDKTVVRGPGHYGDYELSS